MTDVHGSRAISLAAAGAFGLAWCVTWLFLGTRTLVFTLAATGRSSMPGPGWMWIVPVSIVAGFVFGILNVWAAGRAGGLPVVRLGWTGLFWSLSLNFIELGLRTRGSGPGWPMVIVGVVFVALGALPAPIGQSDLQAGWPLPKVTGDSTLLGLSLGAAAAGVAAAVPAFHVIAG